MKVPLLLKRTKSEAPEVMTMSEVGYYLGLSRDSIQRMMSKRMIPCCRVGKHWRFNKTALDKWLEQQCTSHVKLLDEDVPHVRKGGKGGEDGKASMLSRGA